MLENEQKKQKNQTGSSVYALVYKCGASLLLFVLSIIVVACGANAGATPNIGEGPQVTVTIDFNNQTPAPTAPPINCGVWTTNTTPAFAPGSQIAIYGKFTRLVDNVPQGVANAAASFTVTWANQNTTPASARTTADGLAVATVVVPADPTIANKNNEIVVTFSAPDGATCTADGTRAGYFTLVIGSPTAQPTTMPTPTPTATKKNN